MTRTSHLASGAIMTLGFVLHQAWYYQEYALPLIWQIAVSVAIFAGSTAPDWLEIPRFSRRLNRRVSLIPHRTLTHWTVGWMSGVIASYYIWHSQQDPIALITFSFFFAGLVHCFMDYLTPAGVPITLPFLMKNKSAYLIRGGVGEAVFLIFFLAATVSLSMVSIDYLNLNVSQSLIHPETVE